MEAHTVRVVVCVLLILAATRGLSAAQGGSDIAEGKALFAGRCVTCHGFTLFVFGL